ncbi:MAG: methylmalonyl Co-A mutase-associated GTPase MeaB [Acidimicrobiales bacterium]
MSELAELVVAGQRRALARAITHVESTNDDHRRDAEALLDELLPHTGGAWRIGISGTPGVGKSTFIEAFGLHLVSQGHRVAVLAVDPTSARTGGSILGDKTRMSELNRQPNAYIRPSPAGGSLGGITRKTREAVLLCEAAGYDVVLVETVGVGQSEIAVADVTDLFLLLLAPGGGDDLQGIKRGVMELADLVVINKADGRNEALARHTAADYRQALHMVRSKWPGHPTDVVMCSALHGTGVPEIWTALTDLHERLADDGHIDRLRSEQAVKAFWAEVQERLIDQLLRTSAGSGAAETLEAEVSAGRRNASSAARSLIP